MPKGIPRAGGVIPKSHFEVFLYGENIQEKISKLLSLAGNNPSEEEAKNALLAARRLMAKHRLSEAECTDSDTKNRQVISEGIGITFSARMNQWRNAILYYVCPAFRCQGFIRHTKGSQTREMAIMGVGDDFHLCKQAIIYACDCVDANIKKIRRAFKGFPTAVVRQLEYNYGLGFAQGLGAAFKAQSEQHEQEWGLVMVTPKEVTDARSALGKSRPLRAANSEACYMDLRGIGYQDGYKHGSQRRIAEGGE